MAEGYTGIGVATLQLHEIATSYQSIEQTLELQKCQVTGAMVEFVIVPKIIGETDSAFDDTMSCQSGFSDNSMLEAADFEDFNKSMKVRNLFIFCLLDEWSIFRTVYFISDCFCDLEYWSNGED